MTRFAIVPEAAFDALAGDTTALAVFAVLALHADDDGACHPRQSTIAAKLGVSEGTVRRKIKMLADLGLAERLPTIQGRMKTGNKYVLPDRALVRGRARADARSTHARERSPKEEKNMINEQEKNHLEIVTPIHAGRLLDHASIPERVFAAWLDATDRTPGRYQLTPKRERMIRVLLEQGYTVEDLIDAAKGVMRSAWYTGSNPERKVMTGFENVYKDGARVEEFRDLQQCTQSPQVVVPESDNVALIRRNRTREGR